MTGTTKPKPAPLYEQVKQYILARIANGTWADGARVLSENDLVENLGFSRMTVHRALRELSADGLLSRIPGVGTFVAAPTPRSDLLEIRDIAEDIIARGHRHRARVVRLESVRADLSLAATFELRPGAPVFHSIVVHDEDETPVQLEERFVAPAFAREYLAQDFTRMTTNSYLQRIALPTEVEHVVFAVIPDAETSALLEMGEHEACLLLLRPTWTTTAPATRSLFTYPGSRYSLGSRYPVGRPARRA